MHQLTEVKPGTASFREALQLRRDVFEETLGVDPGSESCESGTRHFGVKRQGEEYFVGSFILEPRGLLAQVAVDKEARSEGVGAYILSQAEEIADELGWTRLSLYAHTGSREFYLKHGFDTVGQPFKAEGIPHIRMEKKIR